MPNNITPSLIQTNTAEMSADMLINMYQQIQADYTKNLRRGFREEAKSDLNRMSEINKNLMSELNMAQTKTAGAYRRGIQNQETVVKNNPHLIEIAKQLNTNEKQIEKALHDLRDADISTINSTKQRVSNLYRYIAMVVLSIITIALTVRAYTSDDTNASETVILVLALALAIYHIVNVYVMPIGI